MSAKTILLALVFLAGGAALGYTLSTQVRPTEHSQIAAEKTAAAPERKILYWYDPMSPGTHFDKPGKSPFMDMDLVPRYTDDAESAGIRIDPAQVQNLAVRTEKVTRGSLSFTRDIPANVEYNNYQLGMVQPRAEGFVEKVSPFAVGDAIARGTPLADIIVPAWASDQSEYLLLKNQKADAKIVNGIREKMLLTGMPEEMLAAVDKTGRVQTRMTLKATVAGVITTFDVHPGMNVTKDLTVATIQGTDPVWVTANVPERDLHLVDAKNRLRLTVSAYPDRVFQIDSFTLLSKADQETRTVPLRLSVSNPDGLLKPGITANIRMRGSGEETLLIPTQSLIDLGNEQRVIIRAADGSFVPRPVQVLRSSREQTAIASGLEEGEEVVVSGLFLIDSEANLRGALARMRKGGTEHDAEQHPQQAKPEKQAQEADHAGPQ
ncbi:MAG: efflux RND transporter periplasmic adaptor subunit [Candidatus Adiutrix sp.]|jgi:Cu(I)/Ag(I) efflux system membrane fusion protein|nr:efflux RND transporter periplasmic adaptor subunit [Candidatus Adiutrix sp.]